MRIFTSLLLALIVSSLQANDLTIVKELTKYTELKNNLYLKKMEEKRNMTMQSRDVRDDIRNYKSMKIYASLRG